VKKQSGFAHTRLGNESDEPSPCLDSIKQGRQSFKMGAAKVKKMGIGVNPEWLLAQTEVIEEHWLYLTIVSWRGNLQRNVGKSAHFRIFEGEKHQSLAVQIQVDSARTPD
jgi:hypothetical protein